MPAKISRSHNKAGVRAAAEVTLAHLEAEAKAVGKHAKVALHRAERDLETLRQRAAQSALRWVMLHQDRVKEFRAWAKGTRVESAVNALFRELRAEARPQRTLAHKSATRH